jgi:ligand-binding sensor domain-containing protein
MNKSTQQPFIRAISLALTLGFTVCHGQVKTNLPIENGSTSKIIKNGQQKLLKTQGSQKSDNIGCSLQDKAGNLWFGTTGEGVYRYDGKSFRQFTVTRWAKQ